METAERSLAMLVVSHYPVSDGASEGQCRRSCDDAASADAARRRSGGPRDVRRLFRTQGKGAHGAHASRLPISCVLFSLCPAYSDAVGAVHEPPLRSPIAPVLLSSEHFN